MKPNLCPHRRAMRLRVCACCGVEFVYCPQCFRAEPTLCDECELPGLKLSASTENTNHTQPAPVDDGATSERRQ